MDKKILTDVDTQNKKEKTSSSIEKIVENKKEEITISKNLDLEQDSQKQTALQKSNDFMTNIYLSSQKATMLSQMTMNKSEGLKLVKEGTSLDNIKDGANMLDLGLDNMDVNVEESTNETTFTQQMKRRSDSNLSILNKLALNSNNNETIEDETSLKTETTSPSTQTNTTTNENSVNITVNSNLALSIQNRIVGARQAMSSMMSDIARNMYENYKPPVTAFRINLIPAQLGHIAILMKNERDNSLSINLTMSKSTTHDAMVENQTSLRDALNRTFNNNNDTSFNLNFNMEDSESSSNSFSQQQNENQNNQTHSSDEIVESIIQNQDVAEDMNYM